MDQLPNAIPTPQEKGKKREYKSISQRYCPHMDDNVIISKNTSDIYSRGECLSAHLCGKECESSPTKVSQIQ